MKKSLFLLIMLSIFMSSCMGGWHHRGSGHYYEGDCWDDRPRSEDIREE